MREDLRHVAERVDDLCETRATRRLIVRGAERVFANGFPPSFTDSFPTLRDRLTTPNSGERTAACYAAVVVIRDSNLGAPLIVSPGWYPALNMLAGLDGVEREDAEAALQVVEADLVSQGASVQSAGAGTRQGSAKLPKTRRGLLRLAATTTKDHRIIAALRGGQSYRAVAKACGVGKTTVERVAQAYGLTGHTPDAVPLGGTLQENLTIRGKAGKHRGR